jgi:hypothetical protein
VRVLKLQTEGTTVAWKSRSNHDRVGVGDYFDSRFGNTTHDYFSFFQDGTQTTMSEEHPLWPELAGSGADIGGAFYTDRVWSEPTLIDASFPKVGGISYNGPGTLGMLGLGLDSMNSPSMGGTSSEELRNLAGPVIKAMSPTESEAGLSQMIGELKRDGLPRLIGAEVMHSRARDFRSYGSEYLNYQFGWKPYVSDLQDFSRAVKGSHRILTQFRRDSGKLIRRRAELPAWSDTQDADVGTFYASPLNGNCWNQITAPTRRYTSIVKKRWVVAAYLYHLDPGDTAIGKFYRFNQQADRLLGASLSPELVWELAPWSWAVDWFSNTGNAVSQLSDYINYGPVLKYAYVMETVTSSRTYSGGPFETKSGRKVNLSCTYRRVVKTRESASPFVFANESGELNSQQLAILAALGVSKVP